MTIRELSDQLSNCVQKTENALLDTDILLLAAVAIGAFLLWGIFSKK